MTDLKPTSKPESKPEPQKLAMAAVPQILDLVVTESMTTAPELTNKKYEALFDAVPKDKILAALKQQKRFADREPKDILKEGVMIYAKENGIFAGEAAVKLGIVEQETLDTKLLEQAAEKANAAKDDLARLGDDKPLDVPPWLKANWGNHGVNAKSGASDISAGASAAANVAQNITMLTLGNRALAKDEKIVKAVADAAKLAEGIAGQKEGGLTADEVKTLTESAKEGLRYAVQQAGIEKTNADGQKVIIENGKEIKLDDFIEARFAEIETGAAKRLEIQKAAQMAADGAQLPMGEDAPTGPGGAPRRSHLQR